MKKKVKGCQDMMNDKEKVLKWELAPLLVI